MAGDQIHEWRHPALYTHGGGDLGISAAIKGARAAVPDAAAVGAVAVPSVANGVYRVTMTLDPKTQAQRWVYVNPTTGVANGVRDPEGGVIAWISRFHESLWQGPDGEILGVKANQVVGYLGLGTLAVLGLGLWLYLMPKAQRWRSLRRIRTNRGPYTFGLDLHRVLGVLATPLLALLVVTGLNVAFPDQVRPLWYALTPGADAGPRADGFRSTVPPPVSSPATPGAAPIGLDEAASRALASVPGSELVSVRGAGSKPEGVVQVKLSHGWDPARGPEGAGGNVTVYVDQFTGAVLRQVRPEDKPVAAQAYEYWTSAVHRGTFGGPATRVLWGLVCLTPLILLASGLMTMVIRSRKRRRYM